MSTGKSEPTLESGTEKPNIIFILTDDLGYRDLGCYGQENIVTPNIDSLAANGMRFTDCYSGSAVCAPSRSVLMTGQHTGHTTVRGNFAKKGGILVLDNGSPQRRAGLKEEDTTVAQLLKESGYHTGITGKWGIAEPDTAGVPNRKGFDEWFGYLNQRRAHTYYPPYLWRNGEKVVYEENEGEARGRYSHDMFTEYALDFIERRANGPFFLYLPYTVPHGKFEVPDLGDYADKPWPENAKAFAAMVSRLDRDVGSIMSLLREKGISRNTVTFFCSDNGASSNWDGIFDSLGPFRGRKGDLYEGGIRVPMIAHWPGHIPKGVSDAPWYFADFLPTAASISGTEPAGGVDGANVLPALLGEEQDLGERPLYWEFYSGGFQQAVRLGDWKGVSPGMGEPFELYYLPDDVGESDNVAEEHPELVETIRGIMQREHTPSENWPVGE